MWIAVLEATDGSWALPTDGTKDDAIDAANRMWPTVPAKHRVALYRCDFEQEIGTAEIVRPTATS